MTKVKYCKYINRNQKGFSFYAYLMISSLKIKIVYLSVYKIFAHTYTFKYYKE